MKKTGTAVVFLLTCVLLLAFALPMAVGGLYLDMDGEHRENPAEAKGLYQLQVQMEEKLREQSYETAVTVIQGGAGRSVWVYVSSTVVSETQAEEIAQIICSFGDEFSPQAVTICDYEGANWYNLSGNWSKDLISG